ncbi:MAG TPA: alpha/beta fold hydrolase [Solirubrobacterales bacterium]|nr:alpha/beta fold hydrolase [Solirubrobacterales bacterium]
MASAEVKELGRLIGREALPRGDESGDPVVLLHGYPESSRMWEPLMSRLAHDGRRCLAPDLYGLGDSSDAEPATFERNLETFTAFMDELDLGPIALVVHDWGGFVGLAWACDHPGEVSALVISDTGFNSEGEWHGMAKAIRGPEGEAVVNAMDRDGFDGLLSSFGNAFDDEDIAAYWAPFENGRGQQATLDFYRSMDFEKLAPWQGKLAEIAAPTLLLWGADDQFAPLASAELLKSQIPGAVLVAFDGVGHFVFDEAEERSVEEVTGFLADAA